jgi:DNA-3-methyladenine glycosylase
VLLRALEPLEGLEVMRLRRDGVPDRELCSGPGKLTQALGITRDLDGMKMSGGPVVVRRAGPIHPDAIVATPRIGITKAADWPLRFSLAGSPWTSRKQTDGRST